jgi:hypothetical protein
MTYGTAQVIDQIFRIFNAHAQPDDILRHVPLLPRLLVNTSMAHSTRHADERIDTPEAHTNSPKPRAFYNPFTDSDISGLEREHGTSATRHAPVQIVLGMGLEAGVSNLEAMGFEEVGYAHGIGLLLLHAYTEGLDTSEKEPGIKGRKTTTGCIDGEEQPVCQGRVIDGDDASHEVVMAGQVLGARLIDNIGAEIEGVEQHGRHHGVINGNNGRRVCGVRDARNGWDIANLDKRVGGRFQQHHGRLFADDGTHGLGIGCVDMMHDNATVCRQILEQSVGAAVQVVASDNLVTRAQEAGDDVKSAHAGRDDESAVCVHNLGQVAFEVSAGGIARACVVILASAAGC